MANDTKKVGFTLRIPEQLDQWIAGEADNFGLNKNAMITMLLQNSRIAHLKSLDENRG